MLQLLAGAIAIDAEIHNHLIPEVQRQIFVIISVASTHSFELATAMFVFINSLVTDNDEDIVGGTALREELLHKGLARTIMVLIRDKYLIPSRIFVGNNYQLVWKLN